MQLQGLSHVFLFVADIAKSRDFYTRILGFEVLEEDPEHGGTFLGLPGGTHLIDLVEAKIPGFENPTKVEDLKPRLGMGHLAFHIGSHEALRDAYFELVDNDVKIFNLVDHNSQQSVYFFDPDFNLLEICWERPNAKQMFAEGRGDEDAPLVFTRP